MGKLTTHVLDTSAGVPGRGIGWTLYRLDGGRDKISNGLTNDDGRADGAILDGDDFTIGTYELEFRVGDYFRANRVALSDPPFLDVIPIRFSIADADQHYHVPLLVSPYSYNTYRGS